MSDEDPAYPTDPELCDACRIARSWYQSRGRLCRFHAIERLRQLEDPEQKFRYAVERKGNAEAGDPDRAMSVRLVPREPSAKDASEPEKSERGDPT